MEKKEPFIIFIVNYCRNKKKYFYLTLNLENKYSYSFYED